MWLLLVGSVNLLLDRLLWLRSLLFLVDLLALGNFLGPIFYGFGRNISVFLRNHSWLEGALASILLKLYLNRRLVLFGSVLDSPFLVQHREHLLTLLCTIEPLLHCRVLVIKCLVELLICWWSEGTPISLCCILLSLHLLDLCFGGLSFFYHHQRALDSLVYSKGAASMVLVWRSCLAQLSLTVELLWLFANLWFEPVLKRRMYIGEQFLEFYLSLRLIEASGRTGLFWIMWLDVASLEKLLL